jgi:hypothetical protein
MEDKVMEQKKTMNLWQMIALVVLLAGVTISMFFPVLNPTGQKMVSSFEKFANRYEEDENIGKSCKIYLKEIEDDSKREDREVQCDSYLDNLEAADEKDDGALLFPANGMEFLSKSFILNGGMDKINLRMKKKTICRIIKSLFYPYIILIIRHVSRWELFILRHCYLSF